MIYELCQYRRTVHLLSICTLLLSAIANPLRPLALTRSLSQGHELAHRDLSGTLVSNITLHAPSSDAILNFQVSHPVLVPPASDKPGDDCVTTTVLMDHVFTNSYGNPFVGAYDPPKCNFNRVTLNFTLHTHGTQYDRLGLMFLGDIEIFRTSTAEPNGNRIAYTYVKEVDHFLPLWKKQQKVIFEMPNIVNDDYTGPLYATASATFFTVSESDSRPPADQILPISTMKSSEGSPSAFELTGGKGSVSHAFPPNVKRAVVTVMSNGQQREEYWYRNSLTSDNDKGYFPSAIRATQPHSPFREVQLLIDGQLAGVVWPFPNMFTGGINPYFWQQMVGIDAFDLQQHEIDITPWLGLLCDGKTHTFELQVMGLEDDGQGHATLEAKTGWFWVVTGSIFLFLDSSPSAKPATTWLLPPRVESPDPTVSVSSSTKPGTDGAAISSLDWQTDVRRTLKISARVRSSADKAITWSQDLTYTNRNNLNADANAQTISQTTTGLDVSSPSGYTHAYSYPFNISWAMTRTPSTLDLNGTFSQGQTHNIAGQSVLPNGIQPASFANSVNKCPIPSSQSSSTYPVAPSQIPASFSHINHEGKASYHDGDTGDDSPDENTISQTYDFAGTCIPSSTSPTSIGAAFPNPLASPSSAAANLESYSRAVTINDDKITKDDETFTLAGGTKVAMPDYSDILKWQQPTTLSVENGAPFALQGMKKNSTSSASSATSRIDASILAILGIGPDTAGTFAMGYATTSTSGAAVQGGGNSTQGGIQPVSSGTVQQSTRYPTSKPGVTVPIS